MKHYIRTSTCAYRFDTCSAVCEVAATSIMEPRPASVTERECPQCAVVFTLLRNTTLYCTARCTKRAMRLRRRVREAGSFGEWRWSDFMRIARQFDYCCAYCGEKPERLDPDHVVALARGGSNVLSNLLPTCQDCNSDKRDLLPDEWAVDRKRRGLPSRMTTWSAIDVRYFHLTEPGLIRQAA